MDSTVVAALIGAGAMFLIDILSNIRGTKVIKSKINDLSEQLSKGLDGISEKLERESSTISDEMGTQTRDRKNLSSQHEDMVDLIKTKAKEQSDSFSEQMYMIKEINNRDKAKILRKKEIESSLSERTIEAKQLSETLSYLTYRVGELESEIKRVKDDSNMKSNEIKNLNTVNDNLRNQIYDLQQTIMKSETEKSKSLNQSKYSGFSL